MLLSHPKFEEEEDNKSVDPGGGGATVVRCYLPVVTFHNAYSIIAHPHDTQLVHELLGRFLFLFLCTCCVLILQHVEMEHNSKNASHLSQNHALQVTTQKAYTFLITNIAVHRIIGRK